MRPIKTILSDIKTEKNSEKLAALKKELDRAYEAEEKSLQAGLAYMETFHP